MPQEKSLGYQPFVDAVFLCFTYPLTSMTANTIIAIHFYSTASLQKKQNKKHQQHSARTPRYLKHLRNQGM